MAMSHIPVWLQETGCKILTRQEETTYLGVRIGVEAAEEAHMRDLAKRFKKRLNHWTNRFLSWPAKVTLLRHVLRAIPTYQFLSLGIHNDGFKQLESICRTFLLGTNQDGKARMALIAWEGFTKTYVAGGMNIRPFRDTATALKMRYVTRLLKGDTCEWAQMICFFVRHEMNKQSTKNESGTWPLFSLRLENGDNYPHDVGLFDGQGVLGHNMARHFDAASPFKIQHSLLSTIDEALCKSSPCGTLICIIAVQIQLLWKDRNLHTFHGKRRRTPLLVILKQTREEIESNFSNKSKTRDGDKVSKH
ncbi:hypothetical protein R1sor_008928 [Riccia sorocarpa]|uniref:Uncharacterized protein n=1 Tax=Riccia sorocarpa TaxID=122646 RepID=A0ABD3H752_9MARC